jgi:hypothetical protein
MVPRVDQEILVDAPVDVVRRVEPERSFTAGSPTSPACATT